MAYIVKASSDYGANLYIAEDGRSPDFEGLHADGRIRATYDKNDLSAGDYTYAEDTATLYLTGTGAVLWRVVEEAPVRDFLIKLDVFLAAGMALVEAWNADARGFNADVLAPLPEKLTPPLSLDEWLMELRSHYRSSLSACDDCGNPLARDESSGDPVCVTRGCFYYMDITGRGLGESA